MSYSLSHPKIRPVHEQYKSSVGQLYAKHGRLRTMAVALGSPELRAGADRWLACAEEIVAISYDLDRFQIELDEGLVATKAGQEFTRATMEKQVERRKHLMEELPQIEKDLGPEVLKAADGDE